MTRIPVLAQIKHNSILLSQRIQTNLCLMSLSLKYDDFFHPNLAFSQVRTTSVQRRWWMGLYPNALSAQKKPFMYKVHKITFACVNVVTALFTFPAKDWPHINSLPSAVWEITSPWIVRASSKINHTLCIFCNAVEMMMLYGTCMLSH